MNRNICSVVYIVVFFIVYLYPEWFGFLRPDFFNNFPSSKSMVSCVEWKSNVLIAYAYMFWSAIFVPFLLVGAFNRSKMKINMALFFSVFMILLVVWGALLVGMDFNDLNLKSAFFGRIYCNSFYGTFVTLSLISGAAILFHALLYVVLIDYFVRFRSRFWF